MSSKDNKSTPSSEKDVKTTMSDHITQTTDNNDSGSDIEAEMELIYEDEELRREYEEAREWLENLTAKDLLKKSLFIDEEIEKLSEIYKNNTPYPHLVIEDFIDEEFLDKITQEIKTLEWKPKNNDLYLFHQSQLDLKATRSPLIKKLCQILYCDEFVTILKKITQLPLFTVRSTLQQSQQQSTTMSDIQEVTVPLPPSSTTTTNDNNNEQKQQNDEQHEDFKHPDYTEPDMFSAVYGDTCRLLCHDDELEGRRIAYIIYLTPEWKDEWGGHLDLFNHEKVPSMNDFSYLPTTIGKSYAPRYAQFAFFEVSEKSFHQVREVYKPNQPQPLTITTTSPITNITTTSTNTKNIKNTNDNDNDDDEDDEHDQEGQRLSISGWYHGPRIVRQGDEYIPSSLIQLPAQNATHMKPFVQQCYNQAKMTPAQINTKDTELIQSYITSKLIHDHLTSTSGKKSTAIESKVQIEDNIKFWINKTYLTKQTQKQIGQKFEEESSIDLVNFIKPSIYHTLLMECWEIEQKCFPPCDSTNPTKPAADIRPINDTNGTSPIEFVGPCNQRVYYRYNPQNILSYIASNPGVLTTIGKDGSLIYKFLQFLHSKSFFTLLQLLTGMKIKSSAHEFQLFRPGCYTLAHDNDPEVQQEGLDIIYSLFSHNELFSKIPSKTLPTPDTLKQLESAWDQDDFGGSIHYLVAGEEDELLSVYSPPNTLSLVFRAGEEKIFQFQRYIDHRAPGSLYRIKGLARIEDE